MALSPKNYIKQNQKDEERKYDVSGIGGIDTAESLAANQLREEPYKQRFYLESDVSEVRRQQIEEEREQQRERLRRQIAGIDTRAAEEADVARQRGLAQQLATLQAQRGGNVGAAQRQFARGAAAGVQRQAQDVQTANIQQRQQARNMLAAETAIDQDQFNQAVQNYIAQGFAVEQARQAAVADLERLNLDTDIQMQGYQQQLAQQRAAEAEARRARKTGILGGALSSLASIGGALIASDKNAKKKIKKASSSDVVAALKNHMKSPAGHIAKKASAKHRAKKIVSRTARK